MLQQLIKKKAEDAGFKREEFSDHFDQLQEEDPQDRESLIKNISLQLLSAENPVQVLDIFESNFITTNTEQNTERREIFIEELCMVLYFLKSAIRNLTDEEGKNLIAGDYRANLLIQLIFEKYGKTEVDIAY